MPISWLMSVVVRVVGTASSVLMGYTLLISGIKEYVCGILE